AEQSFAIQADRANIGGAVQLRSGFRAVGRVRLLSVVIGDGLDCEAASFSAVPPKRARIPPDIDIDTHPAWAALNLDGAHIGKYVFMRGGRVPGHRVPQRFSAVGGVILRSAQIGHEILIFHATLDGQRRYALDLGGAVIGGLLGFRSARVRGDLVLQGAKAERLRDDQNSWPESGHIGLDGFQYARFEDTLADAEQRIAWLKRQPRARLTNTVRPQPWDQIVRVLRAMGDDRDAERVAVEKRNLALESGEIDGWRYAGNFLLKWLAEYGYAPHRLVIIMLVVCGGFGAYYHWAARQGIFAPTSVALVNRYEQPCRANWSHCSQLPPEYSTFNPWIYALENSLPVVDFGQRRDWAPMTHRPGGGDWKRGWWVRIATWVHVFLGWAGSLLLAGILSGLIKRE